jgi:hypothetical protein
MDEIWKPVSGFEGVYEVSDLGRVRSLERTCAGRRKHVPACILKNIKHKRGYPVVRLHHPSGWTVQKKVHLLVAAAFLPNPNNLPEVDHVEGNKNDCRACKLEWVTTAENQRRAIALGLKKPVRGEASGGAKLTDEKVREIRLLAKTTKTSHRKIGEMFGVKLLTIFNVVHRKTWAHVE